MKGIMVSQTKFQDRDRDRDQNKDQDRDQDKPSIMKKCAKYWNPLKFLFLMPPYVW